MAVIAGEQLVPAVSGQRHGDLLTGDLAHQVGRDLGDVGERFVPDVRQPADHVDGLGVADLHCGVIGPEVPGHGGRLGRLVEGPVGEPDGEGADRPAGVSLHQGHDGARVDPPGQEGAHRDIGHHPGGHRVGQRRFEPIGQLGVCPGQRMLAGPFDGLGRRPVAALFGEAARRRLPRQRHQVTG